ncbi:MAG TPA: class I SAM-dependent methyltransferase [Gemmatimonadaceae bacterium]|nr:class I SAM-dependent methyltransferase [Gemmatimonadaceae bacterium]
MMFAAARFALKAAVGGAAAFVLVRQCRKPTWLPGRLFLRSMNLSHSSLTKWGLSHASIQPTDTILDVGCGGGRTIDTMAKAASRGRVFGVDYSATSVDVARRVNAAAIEAGRVCVQQAAVSALPFPAATFDLVTAVETHYYWPDLLSDLREIRRVLKPDGRVVLIAEAYRGRRADWLYRPAMRLLRAKYLTVDEHRAALESAGYANVEVHTAPSNGWLCAVGSSPNDATVHPAASATMAEA